MAAFQTDQPNGLADAEGEVAAFEWRGARYPAPSETVRAALAPVAAAERELAASHPDDGRLVRLDRLGNAYAGALAAVQSALANGACCHKAMHARTC